MARWPRSGLAAKFAISVDAGVIDSGYRGPVKVLVTNDSTDSYEINPGDKIILFSNRGGSAKAIEMYYKMGFKEIPLGNSEFARADIKMELIF